MIENILDNCKITFDRQLEVYFKNNECKIQPIFDALKYSIQNGGKRIRPALCYLGSEFCGKDKDYVANLAVGMEMIHSYSLVHDDLPCMDDDELRRGKPTTHIKYGEGMAVLAGDALLNMAFEVFLNDKNFDKNTHRAIQYIAHNSGINGMIGGQCIDLSNISKNSMTLQEILNLNRLKTSCLLKSSLVSAIIKCGGCDDEINDMENFATYLGEIFQIVDDILDKTSSKEILGKNVNQDAENDKITVVDILGIENAREFTFELQQKAIDCISKYGQRSQNLVALCQYLTNRIN